MPELPASWTYEHTDLDGQPHTRARSAAIRDGLINAGPSAHADQPRQADMFQDLRGAQLAEDTHNLCKKHGSFYQPHCWHCTRRRPDRPHRRARQS